MDNEKTKLWKRVRFEVRAGEPCDALEHYVRKVLELDPTSGEGKAFIEDVEENLKHSMFGWCDVEVLAVLELETSTGRKFRVQGSNFLGACSYKSEADFRENSGYFAQMCDEAFEDLLDMLRHMEREGAAAAEALDDLKET